jgi:hypothetical protein
MSALVVRAAEPRRALSFLDAAEQVLRTHGKGQLMHYQEIARLAVELGLVVTRGQTPAATLNAQVGVEINRRHARGEPQRFVRYPRGNDRSRGGGEPGSRLRHRATEPVSSAPIA